MASTSKTNVPAFMLDYPDTFFIKSDGITVFCRVCKSEFQAVHKGSVSQHLKTQKHIRTDPLHTTTQPEPSNSEFYMDLCEAFVAADIPLYKLRNPVLSSFLQKYCGRNIPHETTLRKHYIDPLYSRVVENIKDNLADKPLWVTVDETTDTQGRIVANLVVGTLDSTPSRPHLVSCKILEKGDSSHVVSFIRNNLTNYVSDFQPGRVSLLITDAAPYMLKAGRMLQEHCKKMIHFTCMAHALHRIAERVRENFNLVDTFIANMKKTFLKAPQRVTIYKKYCPNLPLPPQPVLTRWGTWLQAVNFYVENIATIKMAIVHLQSDAKCIIELKQAIDDPDLTIQLQYISRHFGHIANSITQLESRKLSLITAFDIFAGTLSQIPTDDPFGVTINTYVQSMLTRNPGYTQLQSIAEVLRNETDNESYRHFSYAPTTSCEVERTFSILKNILTDDRHSFAPHNLEKYIVIQANSVLQ